MTKTDVFFAILILMVQTGHNRARGPTNAWPQQGPNWTRGPTNEWARGPGPTGPNMLGPTNESPRMGPAQGPMNPLGQLHNNLGNEP